MAQTTTSHEERLTQFAYECAIVLGHDIHPVHFSQKEHIEWTLGESLNYATLPAAFSRPLTLD
ncbi:MAG: hypothetical protein ACTH7X_10425 [Brevibacterium aurantiacum]